MDGAVKPQTILVASHNPDQSDVRRNILEEAGFQVISAMDMKSVNAALAEKPVDLVMVGYSVPPAERRRITNTVRAKNGIPILQLIEGGRHELYSPDRQVFEESPTPDDFLHAVRSAVRGSS